MSSLSKQPARVPLVDPATGLITMPWFRFLEQVYVRAGGADGPTTPELVADLPEDAGVEELKAEFYAFRNEAGSAPPRAESLPADDPSGRIESLEAQLAAAIARIESLEQGNTL